MVSRQVLLGALLLVCLFASSQALQCYECSSAVTQNCDMRSFRPGSSGVTKTDCPNGSCYTIQYLVSDKSATQRGCVPGAAQSYELDSCGAVTALVTGFLPPEARGFVKLAHCSECKSNLCNSAPSQYAMFAVPLILLALGVFAL